MGLGFRVRVRVQGLARPRVRVRVRLGSGLGPEYLYLLRQARFSAQPRDLLIKGSARVMARARVYGKEPSTQG